MVRNRKQPQKDDRNSNSNSNSKQSSASSLNHNDKSNNNGNNASPTRKMVSLSSGYVAIGVASIAIVSYFVYCGYLETRVNTLLDEKKIVQKDLDPEKFWGTYRPHTYFGLKTRDPHSMVVGLMWYFPNKLTRNGDGIRHWCKLEDNLQKYGWIQHDGKNFGVQEIHDDNFVLETSFVKFHTGKFGGEWTARVEVKPKDPNQTEPMSLIWYAALDEKTAGHITPTYDDNTYGIEGETKGLGSFRINLHNSKGNVVRQSFLSTVAPSLQSLRETVLTNLRLASDKVTKEQFIILAGETLNEQQKPNFVAVQVNVELPFTLDITFQSVSNMSSFAGEDLITLPVGEDYTKILSKKRKEFSEKFTEMFQLKLKGYGEEDIKVAEATLSNMLGSIGYFYGSSKVQSVHTNGPVPYWKAPLLTAVPSRSFFPRGFLWDEGFHGLLISNWDIDTELDIMSHWFDLINIEGWIPREQILGVEALARVPEKFVIQHNTNANPPTFFLTLKHLLDKHPEEMMKNSRIQILDKLYPRLHAWFTWFNTTQKGEILGTYRWRGRDAESIHELNPKTLTSGLDDFPRASHPTENERHVDLRCWIALASGVMVQLGNILGKNTEKYEETYYFLTDNKLLFEQHYSSRSKTFADYGLHTDFASLKRPPPPPPASGNQNPYEQPAVPDMIRVTSKHPEMRFVDTTFGYVNLFPFLLQIVDAQHPSLGIMLKKIKDPELLWTNFGLRSLAKTSPLYMKRNTEHDPPYWRGHIWININYLALKSLHYYMKIEGPFAEQAKEIYQELRKNVVSNVIKQYKQTGYIWEQYNDQTGKGSGCYPFTGWSALFVTIMAEKY